MTIIHLAGMIGLGKSSYTEKLSEYLGYEPFYEPVDDNPILEKFYEDSQRYGFALQVHFLNKRFQILKEAVKAGDSIIDRSLAEDIIFALVNKNTGNMSEEEFNIYKELSTNLVNELKERDSHPELLIYLDGTLDKAMSNIQKRGRSYEQVEGRPELALYYKELHEYYDIWKRNYNKIPKLIINTDKYDIHNEKDWGIIRKAVGHALKVVNGETPYYTVIRVPGDPPALSEFGPSCDIRMAPQTEIHEFKIAPGT